MFRKLKVAFSRHPKAKKVAITACAVAVVMSICVISCFAEGATNADISQVTTGITSVFGTLTSTFNFTTIISILSIGIGAAALLYLAWWGLRKIVAMMTKALKGRFNVG